MKNVIQLLFVHSYSIKNVVKSKVSVSVLLSKKFLFERISLAIQRGNAASIRGTFPDSALSEIFALQIKNVM
jgi:hypothetical protein